MDRSQLVERVRQHTELRGDAEIDAVMRITLSALGSLVGHSHRETVASQLPRGWAEAFRDAHYDRQAGREAFVARVATSEHVPTGLAIEHATAALEALAVELDDDVRHALSAELPPDMRSWIDPRREGRPADPPGHPGHPDHPPHPTHPTRASRRVAEGRSGSTRPLSESPPHPEQSDSVAADADPHRETKLSEARGYAQERDHRTLAEGRPGSQRPVSEGRD